MVGLACATFVLVVGPPLLLCLMIWLLGSSPLPKYFDQFEKPEGSSVR